MGESIRRFMNTVIFGKSGFVGQNLHIDGIFPSAKECNLLDYQSTYNWLSQLKGKKIKIVNLAAKVAGAIYNKNHNVEMLYYNTMISLNLIKSINELELDCYYLYLSSVCGYDDKQIMNEDTFFNGIPNINNFGYGIAKKFGVLCAKSLSIDRSNFKSCILIPTNMYGKHDEYSLEYAHVIPSIFIKMMNKKNNSFKIFGNAKNLRSFLYAKDMGKIIKTFLDKEIVGMYNVSPDNSISIYNLVKKIKEITGYCGKLEFGYSDKIDSRKILNDRLKSVLGKNWEFTDLDSGLLQTHNWMLENKIYG